VDKVDGVDEDSLKSQYPLRTPGPPLKTLEESNHH